MVVAGIISIMVLLLVYLVVRNQSLQVDINQFKHQIKSSNSQSKFTLNSLNVVASELQKNYLSRLNNAKKRKLLNDDDFDIANTIITNFETVIVNCCENNATVEEAIQASLESSVHTMEEIGDYVSHQPKQVKLPWSKNSLAGYITACHNISLAGLKQQASDTDAKPVG